MQNKLMSIYNICKFGTFYAISNAVVKLVTATSEKSLDSVGGYLIISTNVSCYQTRCPRQYYLPFSNTRAWCTQHSSTAAVQTSFLL